VHHVSMQDFQSINFWIRAKKKTMWVISVNDSDQATFSAKTDLEAGKWTHVSLKPEDFVCNDDSPVQKEQLDTGKLNSYFVCFDLLAVIQKEGSNKVFIDDVKVVRSPMRLVRGNYVVDGKTRTIDKPTKIQGDIVLTNGAKLIFNASRLEVTGNIVIVDSTLQLNSGTWLFPQKYRYQQKLLLKGGHIECRNGFWSTPFPMTGGAVENSTVRFVNVRNAMYGFTFAIATGSTIEFQDSQGLGEFLFLSDTKVIVKDSRDFLFWLFLGDDTVADVQLPDGEFIAKWSAPKTLNRKITLKDCQNIMWGLIADPGCDVTIRNSVLRAAGMNFNKGVSKVSGINNKKKFYDDFIFESKLHKIKLINTEVMAWNLYTAKDAQLEIRDCHYGESISFDNSKITVENSICDSTGGYFGAKDDSTTIFSNGTIEGAIVTHGNSKLIVEDSKVDASVKAAEQSEIVFIDSEVNGVIEKIGNGQVRYE